MINWSFRGSPAGQKRLAISWLMITTPGALAVSRSVKSRPRMIGILNTLKYSGATKVQPANPVNARLLVLVNVSGGRPDTTKGSCHTVSRGIQHVAVAATTPGTA